MFLALGAVIAFGIYSALLIHRGAARQKAKDDVVIAALHTTIAARDSTIASEQAANAQVQADFKKLNLSYLAQTTMVNTMIERQRAAAMEAKRVLAANKAKGVETDAEIARLLALSTAPPTGPLADEAETILRDLAARRYRRLREPDAKPPGPF